MKRFKLFKISIFILSSLFLASTALAGGLPGEWTEVFPDGFTYEVDGVDFAPACTGAPGTTDDEFTFFVKGGKRKGKNKIVIFFQGGGACWDPLTSGAYNVEGINDFLKAVNPALDGLLAPKCTQEQGEVLAMFNDENVGMGIFDTTEKDNPFKNWGFVYIPYCSGDLFWGAQNTEYDGGPLADHLPDLVPYGLPNYDPEPFTVQHRGFINFQAVLKYLKDTVCLPNKIFVTGSSAGSYGATLGFPYIKKAYPFSWVYLLGDAGNGVMGGDFATEGLDSWNVQMPNWIFPDGYTEGMSMDQVYTDIAARYPWSKLAQYTTAYDGTQVGFLNVMENLNTPLAWAPTARIMCEWNSIMTDYAYSTAASSPNYRYYIAAGMDHTIMMSPKFYTEDTAGGIPYAKWVKTMVRNPFGTHSPFLQGKWKNVECEDCESPLPPGVPCEYLP